MFSSGKFFLHNKTIIISGATSGIGLATALQCIDMGANVACLGRTQEKLIELEKQVSKKDSFMPIELDMLNYDAFPSAIETIVQRFGRIDGFVHSAGICELIPLSLLSAECFQRFFAINAIAGFEFVRILSKKKYMKETGGAFVFVASVCGSVGAPALVSYCASKGALMAGMKALAVELAPKKIRVNAISPGYVMGTHITDEAFARLPLAAQQEITKKHLLGCGDVAQVAAPIVFLLSEAASWITGANLDVDGGYCAQ